MAAPLGDQARPRQRVQKSQGALEWLREGATRVHNTFVGWRGPKADDVDEGPARRAAHQAATGWVYRSFDLDRKGFTRLKQNIPAKWWGLRRGTTVFGWPVIPPWSRASAIWTSLVLCIDATYTAFILPYVLAFIDEDHWMEPEMRPTLSVSFVVSIVFLIDIFMNSSTGYVARHKLERVTVDRGWDILKVYFRRGYLLVDLASVVPWFVSKLILLTSGKFSTAVYVAHFCRLMRLWRVVIIVRELFLGTFITRLSRLYVSLTWVYMIGLFYCAMVLINILTCAWFFLGHIDATYDPETSWLSSAGGVGDITDSSMWLQLLTSMYYIVTTLSTTGYGDITPKSHGEQALAMIFMATGAIFYAFLIASVVNIMVSSSAEARRASKFKDKMQVVESFMQSQNISKSMRKKVFRFYGDTWLRYQEQVELWNEVFADLSPGLKAELLVEILRPTIRELPVFSSLPEKVLLSLAGLLQPTPLPAEREICQQDAPADTLWILSEGEVVEALDMREMDGLKAAPQLIGAAALRAALPRKFLALRRARALIDHAIPSSTTLEDVDRGGLRTPFPSSKHVPGNEGPPPLPADAHCMSPASAQAPPSGCTWPMPNRRAHLREPSGATAQGRLPAPDTAGLLSSMHADDESLRVTVGPPGLRSLGSGAAGALMSPFAEVAPNGAASSTGARAATAVNGTAVSAQGVAAGQTLGRAFDGSLRPALGQPHLAGKGAGADPGDTERHSESGFSYGGTLYSTAVGVEAASDEGYSVTVRTAVAAMLWGIPAVKLGTIVATHRPLRRILRDQLARAFEAEVQRVASLRAAYASSDSECDIPHAGSTAPATEVFYSTNPATAVQLPPTASSQAAQRQHQQVESSAQPVCCPMPLASASGAADMAAAHEAAAQHSRAHSLQPPHLQPEPARAPMGGVLPGTSTAAAMPGACTASAANADTHAGPAMLSLPEQRQAAMQAGSHSADGPGGFAQEFSAGSTSLPTVSISMHAGAGATPPERSVQATPAGGVGTEFTP